MKRLQSKFHKNRTKFTVKVNMSAMTDLGKTETDSKWSRDRTPKGPPAAPKGKQSQHSTQQQDGRTSGFSGPKGGAKPNPKNCTQCKKTHSALFYCEKFIKADVADRPPMVKKQQTCGRCLYMGRKFEGPKKDWWRFHESYCRTKFYCSEDTCATLAKDQQRHFTICRVHATANKAREADFIKSLSQSELPTGIAPANLKFLHMWGQAVYRAQVPATATVGTVGTDGEGYELLPDVDDTAIFMLQTLPAETDPSRTLLCFYDSGCGAAAMSDRACDLLETTNVREGPTLLDVAGGKSIMIPYGDEQFRLELDTGKQKATITALRMARVTTTFPIYPLTEAWEELSAASSKGKKKVIIPTADASVGGAPVDIIMGIKYHKYYPEFVFGLPSGLSVYKAKFKSASGCQAVLGGPHNAWTQAALQAQFMSPRVYLCMEARAWYVGEKWVSINQDKFSRLENFHMQEEDDTCNVNNDDLTGRLVDPVDSDAGGCDHCHCQ